MYCLRRSRVVAAVTLCFPLTSTVVFADDAVVPLPEVVVTATRNPLEIARAGSAIDVIEREDIKRLGSTGLRDVLQSVPGLYIHESGGVGSVSNVTLRGSTPGQTLVLVDGIRIGDPTSTDNAVDLGSLAITNIERIEVLRGPQSALYGSDAMGGVIQIITRRGNGPPKKSLTIEGGSYGTLHTNGSISGGTDNMSYAFSVDALHSSGFPRYGYRPNHPIFLSDGVTPLPPLPRSDPTDRAGMTGRVTYRIDGATEVEFGFAGNGNRLSFDNPYAFLPDNVFNPYNVTKELNGRVYSRVTNEMFDGRLRNQFTLFGTLLDNVIAQTESCPDFISNCRTNYRGIRVGAEYQGDLKLWAFGQLTFGARNETERSFLSLDQPAALGGHLGLFSGQQTTNSVFALHQFTLADRLDLSVAGRVDSVIDGHSFVTGRTTAAWRITETGTKLRASVGSGAKIPSLYQRYSSYGFAGLAPEENIGFDAGVDQSMFDNRLTLSATFFNNRYKNLIQFSLAPSCTPAQAALGGCYYNVGQAATQGVELAAKADIVPGEWRATASYTYLDAIDKITSNGLLQRPRHKAVGSLVYTGVPDLRLEGRMTIVAGVLDFGNFAPLKLPAYYRLDAYADYKVDKNLSVFARLENLTDARYEEVYNYSVAGRSIYAGVKIDW
jgi:vitamin B12 transporter